MGHAAQPKHVAPALAASATKEGTDGQYTVHPPIPGPGSPCLAG